MSSLSHCVGFAANAAQVVSGDGSFSFKINTDAQGAMRVFFTDAANQFELSFLDAANVQFRVNGVYKSDAAINATANSVFKLARVGQIVSFYKDGNLIGDFPNVSNGAARLSITATNENVGAGINAAVIENIS